MFTRNIVGTEVKNSPPICFGSGSKNPLLLLINKNWINISLHWCNKEKANIIMCFFGVCSTFADDEIISGWFHLPCRRGPLWPRWARCRSSAPTRARWRRSRSYHRRRLYCRCSPSPGLNPQSLVLQRDQFYQ